MTEINKLYITIGNLRQVFMGIAGQFTKQQDKMDDAVQMLMLYFLQMNPQTLLDIYNKDGKKGIIRYGAVVLRRSFTSPRSDYYYTYKRYYDIVHGGARHTDYSEDPKYAMYTKGETIDKWELYEKIDKELDKVYWYDRKIYELYYSPDGETLDKLSKKTGISRNSLFTTIDNIRKHLKKVLTDE